MSVISSRVVNIDQLKLEHFTKGDTSGRLGQGARPAGGHGEGSQGELTRAPQSRPRPDRRRRPVSGLPVDRRPRRPAAVTDP